MHFLVVTGGREGLDVHDLRLKFVVGHDGLILNPRFVGIDGLDGIIQYPGDLFSFLDAHPHKGKNAEIGIEQFIFFQPYLPILPQQRIDKRHKIWKQLQEEAVNIVDQDYLKAEKQADPRADEVLLHNFGPEPTPEQPPIQPGRMTMVTAINSTFRKALENGFKEREKFKAEPEFSSLQDNMEFQQILAAEYKVL